MANLLQKLIILVLVLCSVSALKRKEDKTKCPQVKAIRNFNLDKLLGQWYVVQYYASSEEALAYGCMRAFFTFDQQFPEPQVTMNFSYSFTDNPTGEILLGNITWKIPDMNQPADWIHAEDTYEGVYHTYVLDSIYTSWALLLHCAEKSGSTRYLSSFIMSRQPTLGPNVITYLRDKLPRYDIDLDFMFEMPQNDCGAPETTSTPIDVDDTKIRPKKRHPLKRVHKHLLSG